MLIGMSTAEPQSSPHADIKLPTFKNGKKGILIGLLKTKSTTSTNTSPSKLCTNQICVWLLQRTYNMMDPLDHQQLKEALVIQKQKG